MKSYKGIQDLIAAVLNSKGLTDSIELRICGSGTLRLWIDELQGKHPDCIKLLGWADEQQKAQEYTDADIFVMPSWREGLSNSLLEAMLYEKAIVATTVGATPDLLTDKEDALLVRPRDIAGLSSALLELAAEPRLRARLGHAARKAAEEKCDLARCIPLMAKLLRLLVFRRTEEARMALS